VSELSTSLKDTLLSATRNREDANELIISLETPGTLIVPDVASLPPTADTGSLAVDASTTDVYVFDGASWQLKTASGSAGVASFKARSGVVVPASGDYTASQITNVPAGAISSTDIQSAINELATGTANTFVGFDSSGNIESIPNFNISTDSGGMNVNLPLQPNGLTQNTNSHTLVNSIDPLQNSPNQSYTVLGLYSNLDVDNTGFDIGTSGSAATNLDMNINHQGTGDVGRLANISTNYSVGNGTDPITVDGISTMYGFGNVNANVTMDGALQGYGFQSNVNAAASSTSNFYVNAYYDYANVNIPTHGYNSFIASPTVAAITNTNNYVGFNNSPNIGVLQGSAGYIGLAVSPTVTTIGTGSIQGVNINPTASNVNYAAGLNVNMNNVTALPGVSATLVIQDLTLTVNGTGTGGNAVTMQYTSGATAGSEVVSNIGLAFTVQIASGVSTATQVKAALDGYASFTTNATCAITGIASNPQVTQAATSFSGGIDAGRKYAADLVGDVSIQGSLSFTGGLSIGALSSYATKDLATLPGGVNSIDTLVTAPSVAANATVNGIDLLGINTAMLLTTGANSTVTTNFLGLAALGLPAVVSMGAGATIDRVEGAVFAISLDGGAGGGTIAEVDLCRAVAIPNGITSITKLKAYQFDLPFGDPGTTTFGIYMEPTCHNYMAGDLKVGGTDSISNSSTGLELDSTTKAFLPSRMTTTQRDALTAVNGMVLYNTTTNKLQVYASGAWVDLH
jgi:hypothetical protein